MYTRTSKVILMINAGWPTRNQNENTYFEESVNRMFPLKIVFSIREIALRWKIYKTSRNYKKLRAAYD